MKRAGLFISLTIFALLWGIAVLADFGTNWTGAFYDNTTFSGDPVRTVTNINGLNFNWPDVPSAGGVIISEVGSDNFSVRFTSTQSFLAANYVFSLTIDDNVRVFIDGEQVFEDNSGGPAKILSFNRTMTAGTHDLRVDFVEITDTAVLQFQWSQEGSAAATAVITGTPAPTPTPPIPTMGSVSSEVGGLAVRTGPYLGATLNGVAEKGFEYTILARNNDEGGPYTWFLIELTEGVTGWVSGRYFTFIGVEELLPTQGSIFDGIDGAPDIGVYGTTLVITDIRRRPSGRTQILGQVPPHTRVSLIGRTRQNGGDYWYQIRYGGMVGWIPAYLIHGQTDRVPIR